MNKVAFQILVTSVATSGYCQALSVDIENDLFVFQSTLNSNFKVLKLNRELKQTTTAPAIRTPPN